MAPATATDAMQKASTSTEQKQSKQNVKTTAIGGFASIEEFSKNGLADIVGATKSVNAYPQGAARDLYCAYPAFGRIVDDQSDRILGLISKVLKWQNIRGNIQCRQQDEQFEMLMECNDAILERLNSNLDELAGIKKNPQTVVVETRLNLSETAGTTGQGAGSWNLKKSDSSPMAARLITAKNIARPQLKFKVPIDNSMTAPFVPKIKEKPNSLKPLAVLPEYDDSGNIASYLHPYEFELMKWEVPVKQLKRTSPELAPKIEVTELFYVDTVEKLEIAIAELREHKEIAVDVEHHSYRTFQGFTCLVQISTHSKDYIFDALELREDMHLLNEIFTNPKVVKIFHGADLDIEWLQRDLSIYVVNMFDTHQAAKILNFARLSLSYLLKHYCDIEADKTFQLADWRIRPLPSQLVAYARQDTHFLIYIFKCITNDLLDAGNEKPNLLRAVYQTSTELCKKRYVKPMMTAESHMDMYRKSKRIFDNRQLFALREIFQWRDTIARLEDESNGYVLPNHMMLQIAESLPREMQGILACCNPIPPLVRQNLHALHQIILRARDQPLVKPILETETSHRVANINIKEYTNKLHCPHDLSHMEEFRDDLPTLLNSNKSSTVLEAKDKTQPRMCKPVVSIFDMPEPSDEDEDVRKQKALLNSIKFVSPYQRYVAILPLIEKEKLEEAARIEAENKKRQLCPAVNLLLVKQEPDPDIQADPADDMYSLPIKELLKRKYEESVAKKQQSVDAGAAENNANTEEPRVKRFKTETPMDDKLKFVNLPAPSNKKTKQKQQQFSITITTTSKQNTKKDARIENADESDSGPEEAPSTSQAHPAESEYQQRPKQKGFKQKMKNRNMKNKPKSQQSSDVSVQMPNFDYKNVDFRKFQGGAQRAKGTELKPQFHGKGNSNKANNKKFNKLFTFSNVKSNKK